MTKYRTAHPVVPEADIVRACLAYLSATGVFAWRNNTGAVMSEYKGKRRPIRFGLKGSSDIFGVLRGGRFLAIECKSAVGRLTPEQKLFLESVNDLGGLAFVARSVDDVIREMRVAMPAE